MTHHPHLRNICNLIHQLTAMDHNATISHKQHPSLQQQSEDLKMEIQEKKARLGIKIEAGKNEQKNLRAEEDGQIALSQQQIDRLTSISREQDKEDDCNVLDVDEILQTVDDMSEGGRAMAFHGK